MDRIPNLPDDVKDRIPDLPDDVIRYIFSFFPFKELVKTCCCLSKRWNNILRLKSDREFIYCPEFIYDDFEGTERKMSIFKRFVSASVFNLGDFNHELERCTFEVYSSIPFGFHLSSWTLAVLELNVKFLSITSSSPCAINLPSFTSNCLKELFLEGWFTLSSTNSLSALESLRLHEVQYTSDDSVKSLIESSLGLVTVTESNRTEFFGRPYLKPKKLGSVRYTSVLSSTNRYRTECTA